MQIQFVKQFVFIIIFIAIETLSIAQTNHTLQDNDVIISNGYISGCSYNFLANQDGTYLFIPATLQGQTVKGVVGGSWMIGGVFSGCNIVGLTLPNTFEDIGAWAFFYNNIIELNIPSSVTKIGEAAFNKNAITTINGQSTSGIIYERIGNGTNDSTKIISYGGASNIVDFIPPIVSIIDSWAFGQIWMIDSVILPNNIDSIGYGAFCMNHIRNIVLPNNLKFIAKNAFTDNKLTELNIPTKVNYIGFGAFGNNLLEEVNFSTGDLDTIEGRAFCNNQIQEIEIPCNVKYIGFETFFRNKITNVILNQGKLITIGESVFEENMINSFILPEQNNLMGFNGWVDGNNNSISGPPYIASNLSTSYKAEFTTSIKNDFIEKLKIRPNPVKDKLYFDISNVHGIKELWLFNYNGVLLKNWKSLFQNQIDMSMLPIGVYFLIIEDRNGGRKTFKVIKE